MHLRERLSIRWLILLVVVLFVAAACGGDDDAADGDGGAGASDVTIVHGTTDSVVSLDPAGAYDLGSWTIIYNTHNGLLTIPPGSSTPEPELAESCDFDDAKTYTCTLQEGLQFSDGSELTADDVKFSIDRNIKIADPQGASSLLGSLDEVEVVDDQTVTFHLKADDATWPFILTTPAAFIVPDDSYDPKKKAADEDSIGAGPYQLAEYRPGEQAVLEANPNYHGDAPANSRVIISYFDKSSALKLAIEQGEVDVAYRSLTATEIEDLRDADGVEVVEGNGTEIRYLVFNLKFPPGDDLAVRKAVAQTIDRQAIVDNVYLGTVKPLYSMVPEGLAGHVDSFADVFGQTPDVDAAKKTLEAAGIATPVEIEIWWTPTHYGDLSADEYTEIKRSLEESGLFEVTLKSTEWDQYSEAAFTDKYPIYQLGWFPDYTDPDNYTSPFYSKDSFLNIHYNDPKMNDLLAQQKASTDPDEREQIFQQIQQLAVEDIPIIPIWQGDQVGVVREGVTGVEDTFDPSFQFRYWLIGKSE
ncbi:MAG: ABC transporter substrate-binding protein [Actinomycetota bacterium]